MPVEGPAPEPIIRRIMIGRRPRGQWNECLSICVQSMARGNFGSDDIDVMSITSTPRVGDAEMHKKALERFLRRLLICRRFKVYVRHGSERAAHHI